MSSTKEQTQNLPSRRAKFVNPIASNRRRTISSNSGIYKKGPQTVSVVKLPNLKIRKGIVGVMSVIWLNTLSCSFCISAAMKTSCLVDREPGLPLSLPPSSTDVRLEVEEAELGSGLVGSLVTSEPGVLVSTCAMPGKVR